jgi:hypothetical protein
VATVAAWGAVAAFVGRAIDFYIGKLGQQRVRSWLETWWLRLSYVRWGNLGREEALFAVQVMDRLFGRRLISVKRLIGVVGAATFVWGCLAISLLIFGYGFPYRVNIDFPILVIFFLCAFAASFSVTRIASVIVARALTKVYYFNFLGLIFLSAFQYWWFARWGNLVTQVLVDEYLNAYLYVSHLTASPDYPELISLYGSLRSIDWPVTLMHSFNVAIDHIEIIPVFYWCLSTTLNMVPTLIRFSIMTVFISSFLLKPLQHLIMTLWARIIESDKPVFTLVFGGTAALAKAIQEAQEITKCVLT